MYTVLFDVNRASANYGKIVVDGVGLSSGITAIVTITSPLGVVIHTNTVPDIDFDTNVLQLLVALPLVIPASPTQPFQKGTYTISIAQDDNGTPSTIEYTPYFCPLIAEHGGPQVSTVYNCICGDVIVTDATNVAQITDIGGTYTRVLTATPQPVSGATLTTYTTGNNTLQFVLEYVNLYYTITNTIVAEYEIVTNVTVSESSNYTHQEYIQCDYDLCALNSCLMKEMNRLATNLCSVGGLWNMNKDNLDLYFQILSLKAQHDMALACRKWALVQELYAKLKALVDCDCGCHSDTPANGPVPFVPACSGGAGSLTLQGNNPIIVTPTTGGYIISLDPTFTVDVTLTEGFGINITQTGPNEYTIAADPAVLQPHLTPRDYIKINGSNEITVINSTPEFFASGDLYTGGTWDWQLIAGKQSYYRLAAAKKLEVYLFLRELNADGASEMRIFADNIFSGGYKPTSEDMGFSVYGITSKKMVGIVYTLDAGVTTSALNIAFCPNTDYIPGEDLFIYILTTTD